MKMNASQAHSAYGVSRSTVGRWIKSGVLNADETGYFSEADFLALNEDRLKKPGPGRAATPKPEAPKKQQPPKKKKAAPKKKAKPKPPKKPTPKPKTSRPVPRPEPSKPPTQRTEVVISRQAEDLRKASAQANKVELEVKLKLKDLISRTLVSRVFRQLYTIDATEWRGLGPRMAPDIVAICKIEDPAVEVEISAKIEEEVFRTLDHLKRKINAFLIDIESEDRVDDEDG